MQKFSEFVNDYKAFKQKKCGTSELTTTEVKKIRESYEALVAKNAKKLEESKVEKLTEAQIDEKFEETLERYRDWKDANKGTRGVSAKEKENLREALLAKLKESEKCEDCEKEECECKEGEDKDEKFNFEESVDGFKAMVTAYRNWKKKEHGTAKLSENEKAALKAKFLEKCEENAQGEKLEESKVEEPKNERLAEAVKQYKEWKKAEHGTDEVTALEEATIAKNIVLDDIKGKLEEAKKLVESGKKHLAEGDMMDAGADANAAAGAVADATAMGADPAMGGDPNAMAADPNAMGAGAGAALPQNIVDEISAIKTSIDSLATECGIESPVDLGADAGAGVPAVTGAADPNMDATQGAAPADPNAMADPNAGAAPMPESIKSVKDRIAARKLKIEETINYSNPKMKDNGEEMIKTPSEKELLNGTSNISSNVKKAEWPIEPGSDKEPGSTKKLKNIEESQEELAKKTLAEDGEFSWQLYTKLLKSM